MSRLICFAKFIVKISLMLITVWIISSRLLVHVYSCLSEYVLGELITVFYTPLLLFTYKCFDELLVELKTKNHYSIRC